MAERVQVGHQVHVTVALLPVGELVSGDRFHFHVDGEQVVTAVSALLDDLFEKEARVEPLSGQAAVEVGEADQHGVDGPFGEVGLEFFE